MVVRSALDNDDSSVSSLLDASFHGNKHDHVALDHSEGDLTDQDDLNMFLADLQHGSPHKVNLSATKFASTSDFAKVLSAAEKSHSVVELNLSNYLGSACVATDGGSFTRLLRSNKTLQKIDLSGQAIDEQVASDLCNGLRGNSTLRELRLHSCLLDETSASSILEAALVHDTLQVIDMGANRQFSTNFLNTAVAAYLSKSKRVEQLSFAHSSTMFAVDDGAAIKPFLQALAGSKSLRQLCLRHCLMKKNVAEALLVSLTKNQTLDSLDLEFTGFGLRDNGNEILLRLLPQLSLETLKLYVQYPRPLVPQLLQALGKCERLQYFRPRIDGDYQSELLVQSLLTRNRLLARTQELCVCSDTSSPIAILPSALESLGGARAGAGSSAMFQLLKHKVVECL